MDLVVYLRLLNVKLFQTAGIIYQSGFFNNLVGSNRMINFEFTLIKDLNPYR